MEHEPPLLEIPSTEPLWGKNLCCTQTLTLRNCTLRQGLTDTDTELRSRSRTITVRNTCGLSNTSSHDA
eukprot:4484760-Amphidinium_carterae.1